jgi:hypothetical protein
VIVQEGLLQVIGQDVLVDADVENREEVVDPPPEDPDADWLVGIDPAGVRDVVASPVRDVVAGPVEDAESLAGVIDVFPYIYVMLLLGVVDMIAVPEGVVVVSDRGVVAFNPLELDNVVCESDVLVGDVENWVRTNASILVVEVPKEVEKDVSVAVGTRHETVPC